MKESMDESARANRSSSATDWRSDLNLEACELQVETTTRHENLIPVVTKFEIWGVEMLQAQGGEGMRAGQRHCGWWGWASKVGSSGE